MSSDPEERAAVWLADIIDAGTSVAEWTADVTFDGYLADKNLRYATERALMIVAEAAKRATARAVDLPAEVPWPAVRAMGNVLRHEYDALSDEDVYVAATRELPGVVVACRNWLERRGYPLTPRTPY